MMAVLILLSFEEVWQSNLGHLGIVYISDYKYVGESVYKNVKHWWGTNPRRSQLVEIETKFQCLPQLFSLPSYQLRSKGMLYDQTGSEKYNMAASKPKIPISQFEDMIWKQF